MIFPAGDLSDLLHVIFHDVRERLIVRIIGLADLEEDIRILYGRAEHGMLGIKRVRAEGVERVPVQQALKILIRDLLDLVDLVGRAESVKEMQERNAPLDGRKVSDAREIHHFLDAARAKKRKAGLPAVHDVGMIAEDRKRV